MKPIKDTDTVDLSFSESNGFPAACASAFLLAGDKSNKGHRGIEMGSREELFELEINCHNWISEDPDHRPTMVRKWRVV